MPPAEPKAKSYELDKLGRRAYALTSKELRNQLRQAELKPQIFMAIQGGILRLMKDPIAAKMEPLERIRDLTQGIMKAFVDKKMQQSEAARVIACGVVLFHPRGKVEQYDVARYVACELILTKTSLDTEMVQVSQGVGRAFTTLIGLATLLPKSMNKDKEHLEKLYQQLHAGLWMGTMMASNRSTPHGNKNVEQYETAHKEYAEELLQKSVAVKAKSVLGGWLGKK